MRNTLNNPIARQLSPMIDAEELLSLHGSQDLLLIDARSGTQSRQVYEQQHLKGAQYVDLEKDLSARKADAAMGGRHPLPELPDFALVLKRLGINPQSHVVVYDDKHGANAAARFWWMLRSIGHDKVQVLNGGIQAAEKAGFPMSHEPMKPAVVDNYPVEGWKLPMADLPEIQANTENGEYLIVDVREEGRYRGEFEPIDLVAGHIPGAINLPFSTNLGEDGLFLQPEELAQAFHKAFHHTSPDKVAVHCGSGVTACHTLLAMDYAGLVIPKLYVGSWSEWSRNDLEIAREE